MGGCWSLALAIHEETGLPMELYYRGVRPSHVYVVDGVYALDARGRSRLDRVRLGATRVEQVDTEESLLARLTPIAPDVGVLLSNDEVRDAAARAARVIIGHGEKTDV